jgi:hypothetical protein
MGEHSESTLTHGAITIDMRLEALEIGLAGCDDAAALTRYLSHPTVAKLRLRLSHPHTLAGPDERAQLLEASRKAEEMISAMRLLLE